MQSAQFQTRRRRAAIATLLVLSPLIVEVLFGATHLTTLYLLIPQICIYGSAALIIRALVRRYQRGWVAVLLLGIAFAIAEECVILQTSVSPVFFGGDPNHIYSWAFGVNWVYLLWALVYESIWAIVLPIQLTELIFPTQRNDPWVGRWGLAITAVLFLFVSAAIWYRFTQVGIAPGKAYEAPLTLVMLALLIVLALAAAAFSPWTQRRATQAASGGAPSLWLVGLAAFGLSLPWFILPILVYTGPASLPAIIPISIGLAWAAGALLLIRHLSTNPAWQDAHRLALTIGALTASMLAGYLVSGIRLPLDLIGKLVINGIAMLLLISLARKVHRRTSGGDA